MKKDIKGLCLSLRIGEMVMIETPNGLMKVMISSQPGSNKYRILLDCPEEFEIYREEVYARVLADRASDGQ